jgi:hypothetical protein
VKSNSDQREDKQMNHKNGQVMACVLGIDSQPDTDLSQWKLPIVLEYCVAEDPVANQFERSEEMRRLEAAGFVPLAVVVSDADGEAGLGLMIREDTPSSVREYVTQMAQEIFEKAGESRTCRNLKL